jgi:hypothetical protein
MLNELLPPDTEILQETAACNSIAASASFYPLSLDGKVNVCFLTSSELYYKEFRKEEYTALNKKLFIRKPIEEEELIKEINRLISKIKK